MSSQSQSSSSFNYLRLDRTPEEDEADIQLFKEYLRFNTMHPNPNLKPVCEWLKKIADRLGMKYREVECERGLPNCILTLEGEDPSLPSLLLNCHTDVVPIVRKFWTAIPDDETPFSAWEDPKTGFIYARGSQDMKCVGTSYISAIQHLKKQYAAAHNGNGDGFKFKRTVHLLFVPDEEIGGPNGTGKLIHTQEFKDLNVGLALDEGLAHDENRWVIFTGERTPMWVSFIAKGEMGHGAKLPEHTAMDRLSRIVERMTKKRDASFDRLKNQGADLGDVTSFNWTCAVAGVTNDGGQTYAYNVLPREGRVTFDVRVAFQDYDSLVADWKKWAEEFNLEIRFEAGNAPNGPSPQSPKNTPWFNQMKAALKELTPDAELDLRTFPAATDSRYFRRCGIPSYGFSPMRMVPSLLHEHNEYLPRTTYLEGIAVYSKVIPALANAANDFHNAKL